MERPWPWRESTRTLVRARLDGFERHPIVEDGLRTAAVAITLVENENAETSFLLTLRASHLRRHRGQFALPGGRIDPGETPSEAARRELEEELGVSLAQNRELGKLDDYQTQSGYRITPVVFWGDSADELTPAPDEVAQVFTISLSDLDAAVPESGRPRGPLPSLGLAGTRVFAPTAALLVQFAEVALRGRSTRIDDFGEPFFARR